jgi:hypothetical protein
MMRAVLASVPFTSSCTSAVRRSFKRRVKSDGTRSTARTSCASMRLSASCMELARRTSK